MNRTGKHLQSRIARRLLKQVFIFSLALTLFFTAVQAWIDYRKRLEVINENMEQVERFQTEALVTALWNFSRQELASQVGGMLHFPYINYVAVADGDNVIVEAGTKRQKNVIVRTVRLARQYKGKEVFLGDLQLQADSTKVLSDVIGSIAITFLFQAVTVAVVALLLFMLYERMVTRHLSTAANYFRKSDIDNISKPLMMDKNRSNDELDILADSFNSMREKLSLSYRQVLASQQGLLQAEKRFRDLLETIQLIAVMLDREGNITFCNDYLLGLTGWSKEEVLNKNWFDLFITEKEEETVKAVFRSGIAKASLPAYYENYIRTRQGAQRLVSWNNSILRDAGGRIIGIASIGIDVTEHRRLEMQLRQSQKMEAVGHLAGGVAHDFNNILTAIVGYASILRIKIPEDDPLQSFVSKILASSERASTLTHSLLAFSRKETIAPRPYDINDIVLDFQKIVERIIGEDIELKISTGDRELVAVVDKGQTEQILLNLATNARDAMPQGGTLSISTQRAEIDDEYIRVHHCGKTGNYALVSVSDTGVGIDDKIKERIFEPFFTTKAVGKGTGLGLSMVYGMVNQLNGFINVSSEPGEGATFNIYLPLADSTLKSVSQTAVHSAPSGNETILLVEDDERVREVARLTLESSGYTILEAADGEDALRIFRENKDAVQLILCDVIMPRLHGKGVYDETTKIKPGIKVLFMSGYTADVISTRGLLEEGINFIPKPVRPDDLLRKVREILDS